MAINLEQTGLADEKGPDDAFERVFLAMWPRIHATLTRLVGDADEAEDLALEAFWRLYRRPPRDRDGGVGGWLYRVAMNLGFNALRARRRRQGYETAGGQAWIDETAASAPDVAAADRARSAQVRATLAALSERDGQVLMLRYSGYSYQEIAEALKVAPGSVGTLLARAEAAFEAQWHRQEDQDGGFRR